MDFFSLHQRYTSQGEPELGIGIVTETSKGKVALYFPNSKEKRLYASESAPLRRLVFKAGDSIKDTIGEEMLILRVQLEGELYTYYGKERKISEADLGDVTAQYGAEERLLTGDVDTPQSFSLRRETLQHDYSRRLSAVSGFVGGRIDLIPHQLYIAHEVSSRYAPRVLLSDQVGLGKTIEACLILHRMLLAGRISRVIILVPESLVHQWFVELLRRFNIWFSIFDEERCASLDAGAPDGNPFLDDQLILCSTHFMAGSAKRSMQAISAGWDMLVVDEAHHLAWSVDKMSQEYAVVEQLSAVAKGLLLLTATPEQLGAESHFARLRLLDPIRYSNFNDFREESFDHKQIADVVEKLDQNKKLLSKETKLLNTLFSKERIASINLEDAEAKNQLIEDLLDQYGPGRVLFRNTRAAIKGFPKRKAIFIPLEAEVDQRSQEEFDFALNLNVVDNELQYTFDDDPRFDWLLETIRELYPLKVLLICKNREKVLALEAAMGKRGILKVAVFHEELTLLQRDKNAAWFAEKGGAQILLCSEIGSEGRNFQFAHHLILFDLPLHPELLEQRIGRLDRIGQTEEIQIHIPYLLNTPQESLVRWFHEGLNAFEENLEGGNELGALFTQRLLKSIQTKSEALNLLIQETATFRKEMMLKMSEGRNRLLEINSHRPLMANKLVEQIKAVDNDRTLEKYFTKICRQFDLEMEELSPRSYFLQPASEITEVFPYIPQEGISVSFDRKRALSREEISFLNWDHPITTASIDLVLSSGTGSASFGVLRGGNSQGLLLELLFMLETSGEKASSVDRFLPNTLIRLVVDHHGKVVTDDYSTEQLDLKLTAGDLTPLLEHETLVEITLPNMIATATKRAQEMAEREKAKGLKEMHFTLQHEIDRLKALAIKNSNIRPQEIQIALNEQLRFESIILGARVRLDALQLILKQ